MTSVEERFCLGRVAHTKAGTYTPGAPFMQSHCIIGPSREARTFFLRRKSRPFHQKGSPEQSMLYDGDHAEDWCRTPLDPDSPRSRAVHHPAFHSQRRTRKTLEDLR